LVTDKVASIFLIFLQDVLGYLIKYEATHTFVPKNMEKAKTLREIYIKDLGYVSLAPTITYITVVLSYCLKIYFYAAKIL